MSSNLNCPIAQFWFPAETLTRVAQMGVELPEASKATQVHCSPSKLALWIASFNCGFPEAGAKRGGDKPWETAVSVNAYGEGGPQIPQQRGIGAVLPRSVAASAGRGYGFSEDTKRGGHPTWVRRQRAAGCEA